MLSKYIRKSIKKIEYSNKFLKSLSLLPESVIEKAVEKEKIFKEDPFHKVLKTHKLSGREKEHWAFWINYSYRVKFVFLKDEEALFLDIGTHDIYD